MFCPNCFMIAASTASYSKLFYDWCRENPHYQISQFVTSFTPQEVGMLGGFVGFITSALVMKGTFDVFANFMLYINHPLPQYSKHMFAAFIAGSAITSAYLSNSSDSYHLKPFHISHNITTDPFLKNLATVDISNKIEDIDGDTLLIADEYGSNIFSKHGLNYIIGSNHADHFYFSLCSTRFRDNKTTVIHNFQENIDRLYLFCTKKTIYPEDISTRYYPDADYTVIEIDNKTAFTLLGYHPNIMNDISLNEKWDAI